MVILSENVLINYPVVYRELLNKKGTMWVGFLKEQKLLNMFLYLNENNNIIEKPRTII